MFTVEQREALKQQLLERAGSDGRIVAAAEIGATAGQGDRWSDIDLTFGVAGGAQVSAVLQDWTAWLASELQVLVLFDLPVGATIYRVFLFPGALQVDLSFSPAVEFGARGPRFRLLFGEAIEHPAPSPPSEDHLFGMGIHHAVRAHICILRGRLWQAEYWIHELRDLGLTIACRHRRLETSYGRGFDALPPDVLDRFAAALPASVEPESLRSALSAALKGLLQESQSPLTTLERLERELQELLTVEGASSPVACL